MPNYAKFLREVISKKRKLEEFETMNMTEESLGLGEVKPTKIALQLADKSIKYPRGIIEDVLVKVDRFIFPVDFVVLDMEEDGNMSLILGRPFLATAEVMIDVKKGALTMGVEGEKVTLMCSRRLKNHPRRRCSWLNNQRKWNVAAKLLVFKIAKRY
ncbi:uncharacterized protein [Henckelia pumila]|uniref:uncharacterized protein n=1 Tax=Henckelia pumila TaxID=405737 RepID=UPI003C6E8FE2